MILTIVKVLSLKVRFGVHDDINMVPAFLRCFPNVEALHITVLDFYHSILMFLLLLLLLMRNEIHRLLKCS